MGGAEAEEMVNATTADLTTQSPEEQVVELVRALLLHMRTSEGKEWVDITNKPKAALEFEYPLPRSSAKERFIH